MLGGKGVLKGSLSLVSHTTAGVFNSVSKVTDALGTGISTLAFDKKFMEER